MHMLQELGRLRRRESSNGGDDTSGGTDANGSGYNLAGTDSNASGFRDDELFSSNLVKWRPSGALIHHLTEHSQAVGFERLNTVFVCEGRVARLA